MEPTEALAEVLDNISLIAVAAGQTDSYIVAGQMLSALAEFGWHLVQTS